MSLETRPQADLAPVPDPGLEEHIPRYADTDTAAGNHAYRQVVTAFALVPLLVIGFCVAYFAVPRNATVNVLGQPMMTQHLLLGLTFGLAVLLIGIGAVQWARLLMVDKEIVQERHPAHSSAEAQQDSLLALEEGIDDTRIERRGLIGGSLAGALGLVAVPAVVALADLGPWPTAQTRKETIEKTIWRQGIRLVNDVNKIPLKATDLQIGQLVNAEPENLYDIEDGAKQQVERAKAAIILVRMDPASIKIPESRRDWQVGGILCYSKICTHVGCPISLWEQQTHHLLCPCHQSTFDLGDSGVVVFGPAARSLPQLPITVDAQGYLVARSDFTVPVGPSFFERDSNLDYKEGDR